LISVGTIARRARIIDRVRAAGNFHIKFYYRPLR